MTIEQYLNEYLDRGSNIPGTTIQVFEKTIPGKGTVTVEYSPETDKADVIHLTQKRQNDFYEASSVKDLKDVVEFCLGPLVSDKDWEAVKKPVHSIDSDDYDDIYTD